MAYSAKYLKESLGQGEDMERDEERVEPHISGVRNLSETAREMRAAGRKLVNEDDDKEKDIDDYDRLSGAVKKLQESVDAQKAEVAQTVKRMNQILYEMRGLVDEVERIYTDARDESHSAEQAALNGVNKAQEKAQEITLRNIDEATQRSKKAIDTMVLESKRRIERLAMVTLPDRMFHDEVLMGQLTRSVSVTSGHSATYTVYGVEITEREDDRGNYDSWEENYTFAVTSGSPASRLDSYDRYNGEVSESMTSKEKSFTLVVDGVTVCSNEPISNVGKVDKVIGNYRYFF